MSDIIMLCISTLTWRIEIAPREGYKLSPSHVIRNKRVAILAKSLDVQPISDIVRCPIGDGPTFERINQTHADKRKIQKANMMR